MALVSAAVAAIAAVAASVSVASVATAVVAVSALVGTIGLAVTAVGMVTKNQDLLKAGKIMGYVGLAGGIAGWTTGSIAMGAGEFANHVGQLYSSAWDTGVGSLFKPDPAIAAAQAGAQQEALGQGIVAAANPEYAKTMSAVAFPGSDQAALGQGIVAGTQGTTPSPVAAVNPVTPVGTESLAAGTQAPIAAAAPTSGTTAPVASTAGTVAPGAPVAATGAVTPPPAGTDMKSWWDKIPDWQKSQLILTAGQGVAGMASGWMAGMSAEQRLELDKLINAQNQNQRELINRNNRYAPSLSFNKGLIGAAGRPA